MTDTITENHNDAPASPNPEISFPLNRPHTPGEWTPELDAKLRAQETSFVQVQPRNGLSRAFFPGGDRSLSGIALRAFLLGVVAVISFLLSVALAYLHSHLWRPPFFLGTLCIFHFLEFYVTAEYNTPSAYVSSFLLTNGNQYRIAHSIAFVEALITSHFLPGWQARVNPGPVVALGTIMVIVGQVVRSVAMAQAGTNFNHKVQSRKSEGHELVTTGLYAYFRHPSYFGFFWWGLGTQVVLGNTISFIGYAGVMWYFFKTRITHEEKHLIEFFGEDYRVYRTRTPVWIPFI